MSSGGVGVERGIRPSLSSEEHKTFVFAADLLLVGAIRHNSDHDVQPHTINVSADRWNRAGPHIFKKVYWCESKRYGPDCADSDELLLMKFRLGFLRLDDLVSQRAKDFGGVDHGIFLLFITLLAIWLVFFARVVLEFADYIRNEPL